MWKKIGAINNNTNDNQSSRSRDQNNQYEPFSQMSKIRLSESQIGYQQSQYFCPNYLSKKKSPDVKYLSQTKIKTQKQIKKIYVDNQEKYRQTTLKKKIKTQSFQEMKKKISQLEIFEDNQQQNPNTPQFLPNQDEFIQKNKSSTSIQFQNNTLRHYGSSPQLKSFNSDLIIGKSQKSKVEIQADSANQHKIETASKLKLLKQQQKQFKKQVKQQMKSFNEEFAKIKGAIKEKMQQQIKKEQNKALQMKKTQPIQNIQFLFQKSEVQNIIKGTTDFCNKLAAYDSKKNELYKKYKLLKGK